MNLTNKISPYALLVLAWLVLTTLQAQEVQQADTLRFDPETGEPLKPKPALKFDPETGLPVEAKPAEPRPAEIADDEKDKRPPLLSQDLLVDSEGGEYSGTLIEITDTHIYFQLPGRTTPIQIPLKSVKRVTLADGSIAYEAEPEPARIEVAAAGEPPVFTEAALRTMALKNAARDNSAAFWKRRGRDLGCGGMYLGAMLGAEIAGSPGRFIGAGIGYFATAELIANAGTALVPIPEELESADPELREKYHQLYLAEVRELRKRSFFRGVLSCAVIPATCAGLVMLSILLSR